MGATIPGKQQGHYEHHHSSLLNSNPVMVLCRMQGLQQEVAGLW